MPDCMQRRRHISNKAGTAEVRHSQLPCCQNRCVRRCERHSRKSLRFRIRTFSTVLEMAKSTFQRCEQIIPPQADKPNISKMRNAAEAEKATDNATKGYYFPNAVIQTRARLTWKTRTWDLGGGQREEAGAKKKKTCAVGLVHDSETLECACYCSTPRPNHCVVGFLHHDSHAHSMSTAIIGVLPLYDDITNYSLSPPAHAIPKSHAQKDTLLIYTKHKSAFLRNYQKSQEVSLSRSRQSGHPNPQVRPPRSSTPPGPKRNVRGQIPPLSSSL